MRRILHLAPRRYRYWHGWCRRWPMQVRAPHCGAAALRVHGHVHQPHRDADQPAQQAQGAQDGLVFPPLARRSCSQLDVRCHARPMHTHNVHDGDGEQGHAHCPRGRPHNHCGCGRQLNRREAIAWRRSRVAHVGPWRASRRKRGRAGSGWGESRAEGRWWCDG